MMCVGGFMCGCGSACGVVNCHLTAISSRLSHGYLTAISRLSQFFSRGYLTLSHGYRTAFSRLSHGYLSFISRLSHGHLGFICLLHRTETPIAMHLGRRCVRKYSTQHGTRESGVPQHAAMRRGTGFHGAVLRSTAARPFEGASPRADRRAPTRNARNARKRNPRRGTRKVNVQTPRVFWQNPRGLPLP